MLSKTTPKKDLRKVSVLIPSYNTARYIREAIDSVLAQDYPNKEVIVIDDGSTDETIDILGEYGSVIKVLQQQNQGAAVARNRGIEAAQGDYIAFLDSDDVWLPGKLSTQIAYLEAHPDIGLIYSRWKAWKPDEQGQFVLPEIPGMPHSRTDDAQPELKPEGSGWLYNRLLFSSLLHTITVVARRSLIEQVGGFDPDLKRGQDYDYWIRASRHTPIHQLDQVMALYRLHGNGCIRKWPDRNYEGLVVQRAVERWGLTGPSGEVTDQAALNRRIAQTHLDFAYHHYWEGQPRLAVKSSIQALRLRPLHLGTWRYLAASVAKGLFSGSAPQQPGS